MPHVHTPAWLIRESPAAVWRIDSLLLLPPDLTPYTPANYIVCLPALHLLLVCTT